MAYDEITYADKVENNGATPAGRFGADDLNEIKTVTNANGSNFDGRIDALESGSGIDVSQSTVVSAGSTVSRKLTDRFADTVNVKDFGAVGDGVTDDTAAIQAALDSGNSITANGTFLLSSPLVATTAGQIIFGDGIEQSKFKASTGFTGAAVIIMGNKSTAPTTRSMGLRDMEIDCSAVNGLNGLEIYGLRDGSTFTNLYVTGVESATGILSNMSGNGTGVAAGKMNQGVQFQNCHVITFNNIGTGNALWKLDGLFESQLIGCKALGSSVSVAIDSFGFQLGSVSEVRGTVLLGCSVGNLRTSGNTGIHYGVWARNCWDQYTTLEGIDGCGVYFHGGLISGFLGPLNCRSTDPRPYNASQAGILDPLYRFGDANSCYAGIVSSYDSSKVWGKFDAPVESQFNNHIDIKATKNPADVMGTVIVCDPAAAASNSVAGYSSEDAIRKSIELNCDDRSEVHHANKSYDAYDQFWSTSTAGTSNTFRWRSNGTTGNTSLLELDGDLEQVTPKVRLRVGDAWDDANKITLGQYRIWVDSAGKLRIKFGEPTSDTDGTIVGSQS